MRISIITATHNRANVIRGAIEGVLRQNYKDYGYIIVDSASKDNTIDILLCCFPNNWSTLTLF